MLLSLLMAMGAAVRSRTTRNLSYAAAPGAQLDVYAPIGADGEAPVILFVHCGRTAGGERRHFRFIGNALSSRGFVTAVADGRLDPGAEPDCEICDLAAAMAWIAAHAARFGGDPGRIFLMGHEGGAHDVARLCLDGHDVGVEGLRGVIGISGAYDPLSLDAVHRVARPLPPMLLISGQNDTVDPQTTSRLASALRTIGGQVAEIRYPKLCDQGRLQRLTGPIRFRAIVLGEVERFVRLHSLEPVA